MNYLTTKISQCFYFNNSFYSNNNDIFSSQVPQNLIVLLTFSHHFVLVHLPLLDSCLSFPKTLLILQLGLGSLFDLNLHLSIVVDGFELLLLCHSVSLHLLVV